MKLTVEGSVSEIKEFLESKNPKSDANGKKFWESIAKYDKKRLEKNSNKVPSNLLKAENMKTGEV